MVLTVGLWSSFQIRTFSNRIEKMLQDNDNSIQYALKMQESLLKISDFVIFNFDKPDLTSSIQKETEIFWQDYEKAKHNITEPGEEAVLANIKILADSSFGLFAKCQIPIDLKFYIANILPVYEKLQSEIDELRSINSSALYKNALSIVDNSKRVALPGDILVVIAILFFLMFAWLTQKYIVTPITEIISALRKKHKTGVYSPPQLDNKDEIADLAREITELAQGK
jgi:methyl-accepting chemotaxis protein